MTHREDTNFPAASRKILIDDREQAPALRQALEAHGFKVEVVRLKVGDYVIARTRRSSAKPRGTFAFP